MSQVNSLLVCGIHGTLMPESLVEVKSREYRERHYSLSLREALISYLQSNGTRLALLSGGTNVEITANLEYLNIHTVIPITLVSNNGAMISQNGGKTWQPLLLSLNALNSRYLIEGACLKVLSTLKDKPACKVQLIYKE